MLLESTLLYLFSNLSKFLSKFTKVQKGEQVSYKAPRFVVTVSHPAAIASIAAMQLVQAKYLDEQKYAFFLRVQLFFYFLKNQDN